MTLQGSCLCGGVRYEIHGTLRGALNCHCRMCRKAHGAAFRSRAAVRSADFLWLAGEELVTYYESSPGTQRGFCRVCGSNLISRFHSKDTYGLALGSLDDDPGIKPLCHVYVGSKAPWHDINDNLPQFETVPS